MLVKLGFFQGLLEGCRERVTEFGDTVAGHGLVCIIGLFSLIFIPAKAGPRDR
jgi:hypothetical protein